MDGRKHVKNRIFEVEQSLDTYVFEHRLEGVAVNSCRCTPEHGRVVVTALVEGAIAYDFEIQVRKNSDFRRTVDDPETIFNIMYKKGEKPR